MFWYVLILIIISFICGIIFKDIVMNKIKEIVYKIKSFFVKGE